MSTKFEKSRSLRQEPKSSQPQGQQPVPVVKDRTNAFIAAIAILSFIAGAGTPGLVEKFADRFLSPVQTIQTYSVQQAEEPKTTPTPFGKGIEQPFGRSNQDPWLEPTRPRYYISLPEATDATSAFRRAKILCAVGAANIGNPIAAIDCLKSVYQDEDLRKRAQDWCNHLEPGRHPKRGELETWKKCEAGMKNGDRLRTAYINSFSPNPR